jgi:hypothetical protein
VVLSTSTLRSQYGPACDDHHNFRSAYVALDSVLEAWGYRPGTGTGAYNCRRITGGTGYSLHAYKDSAGFTFWNGYTIPDMALAVDINPGRNPYGYYLVTDMPRGMVNDISAIRTNDGDQLWYWGGYFEPYNDAMHYQISCSRASLLSGIKWSTVANSPASVPTPTPAPTPAPEPTPTPTPPKDDDLMLILLADGRLTRFITPLSMTVIDSTTHWGLAAGGVKQAKVSAADYDEIITAVRATLNAIAA